MYQEDHDGWFQGAILANVIGWLWIVVGGVAAWALRDQVFESMVWFDVALLIAIAGFVLSLTYKLFGKPVVPGRIMREHVTRRVWLYVILMCVSTLVVFIPVAGGQFESGEVAKSIVRASYRGAMLASLVFLNLYAYWRSNVGEVGMEEDRSDYR